MNQESKKKLTIFITIDTEDSYFEVPRLITGEGLKGQPGIYKILEITENYGFKANVFLDVYGHTDFQTGVIQNIAETINTRGHEIELHTHPNNKLDFYKENIYKYPLSDQIKILDYGKKLIYEWTGKYPIAHRGGSYAIDDHTFVALHQLKIPIDCSLFFNNKNNRILKSPTINKITFYKNILIVPVSYVRIIRKDRSQMDSKFDIDALTYDELIKIIQIAKENNLRTLTLFLHSFSFIQKKIKNASEENDPRALFQALSRGRSVKCEINGVDENDIMKYERLLNLISCDPEIEVLTLKEWYCKEGPYDMGEDVIMILERT